MLAEALIALASAGGTTLVSAMVTDSWDSIKTQFVRMFSRGNPSEVASVESRLEQSRNALEGLSGQALQSAQAEQEVVWRTRLRDLLEVDPHFEADLRSFVAETRGQVIGSAEKIEQQAAAFDQAQQAVQGQGVQNVTFGSHGTDAAGS